MQSEAICHVCLLLPENHITERYIQTVTHRNAAIRNACMQKMQPKATANAKGLQATK
jgi:hypothetical protein